MKLTPTFLYPVVLSLFTGAASAALPAFSPQTIAWPPLALKENAKDSLPPFQGHASAESVRTVFPQRQNLRPDKFAFSPPAGVDCKLLIKQPDPNVDYMLIVKQVGTQPGK